MFRKLFFLLTVLLFSSSCVSRTIYKETSLKGDNPSGRPTSETKIVWFWDKDFKQP